PPRGHPFPRTYVALVRRRGMPGGRPRSDVLAPASRAMPDGRPSPAAVPAVRVQEGLCYAFFAYEVGLSINLDEAERRITTLKERARIRHKRRAPSYFEYTPPPLRVTQEGEAVRLGPFTTMPAVDLLLYDFGALSVSYTIPLRGSFADLLALSESLYENG